MCLATPGQIKKIYKKGQLKMGRVDFGDTVQEICLEYLPQSKIGDYIIAHNGAAINRLSKKEVEDIAETLKEAENICAHHKSQAGTY